MTIVRIATLSGALAVGLMAAAGCESGNPPDAVQANASQSAPYTPGTGVASSSYDRHPRFYTGPNGDQPVAPATQPSGGQ